MRMQRIALTCVLVVSAACASLSVKQKASNAHLSVRQALVAVDELERGICLPNPAAVNTCTAKPVVITDAQHQQVSRLLAQAFAADARVGEAIIAWVPGTPTPTDLISLQTYVNQVQAIANALPVNPKVSELIARVQALLDAIVAANAAFGGK